MPGPIIRSSNLQFFLARADQARAEGDAATLDHVRERCRRSEEAWQALADKAERSERLREQEVQRKAAETADLKHEKTIHESDPAGSQHARDRATD